MQLRIGMEGTTPVRSPQNALARFGKIRRHARKHSVSALTTTPGLWYYSVRCNCGRGSAATI